MHAFMHTLRQILFVCKDENNCILHLSVVCNAMEFLPCLVNSFPVCTIHHKYQSLCARVVVPPQRSDLVLSTDILKNRITEHT